MWYKQITYNTKIKPNLHVNYSRLPINLFFTCYISIVYIMSKLMSNFFFQKDLNTLKGSASGMQVSDFKYYKIA